MWVDVGVGINVTVFVEVGVFVSGSVGDGMGTDTQAARANVIISNRSNLFILPIRLFRQFHYTGICGVKRVVVLRTRIGDVLFEGLGKVVVSGAVAGCPEVEVRGFCGEGDRLESCHAGVGNGTGG